MFGWKQLRADSPKKPTFEQMTAQQHLVEAANQRDAARWSPFGNLTRSNDYARAKLTEAQTHVIAAQMKQQAEMDS